MTVAIRTAAHRAKQHGDAEQPGPWHIRCDHPGCDAEFHPFGVRAMSDIEERQHTRAMAEQNGWYVAMDRGVPATAKDLCPDHTRKR